MKSQADVHALRLKLKRLKGESHDVEGRREQRERLLFTGLQMLKRSSVKTT
jgi:hypothetical protein